MNENIIRQMKMAFSKGNSAEYTAILTMLRNRSKYTNEQVKLMERVKNGKIWLHANPEHPAFEKHMKVYEGLVDQLRVMGITEQEVEVLNTAEKFESVFGLDAEEVILE